MHHTFIHPIDTSGFERDSRAEFKGAELNHMFEGLSSNSNSFFLAFQCKLKFLNEIPPGLGWTCGM